MGRNLKVYPHQIEDILKEAGAPVSVREMAKELNCTPPTIRKNLKILRREDKPVLPTRKGSLLVDSEVKEKELAEVVIQSACWAISGFIALAEIFGVQKKPFLEAKRILQKELPIEERRKLRQMSVLMTRAVDSADIEQEFEPLQLEM